MKDKAQIWKERIQECENSDLSRYEWCERNNIAPQLYYYYLKHSNKPFYVTLPDEDKLEYICRYLVSCDTLKGWCYDNDIPLRCMRYWIRRLEAIPMYNVVIMEYKERRRLLKMIKLFNMLWDVREYKKGIVAWCREHHKSERTLYVAKRIYKVLTTDISEYSPSMLYWLNVVRECEESGTEYVSWCEHRNIVPAMYRDWRSTFAFADKLKRERPLLHISVDS